METGVVFKPLELSLVWIVWGIERKIEEERPICMSFNETDSLIRHQVRKKTTVFVHLLSIPPEVVTIGPAPVEEVGEIVDTTSHVSKRVIKSLVVRHGFRGIAQVPLANVGCSISLCPEQFRDG